MKSTRTTNVLLVLVILALLANVLVPMLQTREAEAVGQDAASPSQVAATAQNVALEKVGRVVADGLAQIAQSNQQIANAILEHSRTNEHIADALVKVAIEMRSQRGSSFGE
ncbi:MAG: hypothetical protein C4532_08855 [Candidatus Abyssobacteria bacterium SURF_17]|uniref:Uncharacterized protein n=1 Tax=Candidatus Abyssobacteria bacterium SURF_17 TaxID=2093361 RepID=A0A419EZP0_9BACT|nr:MAG: hypothetical protein C4532_08855 [Candidatus Abyssubacteria bacterium SURF_17]